MSYQYDIDIMSRVFGMLNSLPNDEYNKDYQKILGVVKEYLLKHCKHTICNDEIDIDVEKSKGIRYCECCYMTFD